MGTPPSAYDLLGERYDVWCRSVTEDIPFYVDLALASGGPVLEIGVGSGRVAVPTGLAGVRVVGVDASESMLELARRRAAPHDLDLTLVRADMRDLPDLGTFPLVTVPFRAFLHLQDDEERLAVLRALRDRLDPGGTLAFDVFHPDRLDIAETHGRWIEREPGIDERALWDEDARRLELTVHAGDVLAEMELWWVEPHRWRALLDEAGFEQVRAYGWFDRRPLKPDATDSVWTARRPTDEHQSVHLDFPEVTGPELNRWLPLVKWLLAIPHYFVLFFLSIAAFFVLIYAWFAILFSGRYPRGAFEFIEGVLRWGNRVGGYAFTLVTDAYPPFRLAA